MLQSLLKADDPVLLLKTDLFRFFRIIHDRSGIPSLNTFTTLSNDRTDRKPAVSETVVAYANKVWDEVETQRTILERPVAR